MALHSNYSLNSPVQLRDLLIGFRKQANLTQAALAEKLGITQQSYAQIEANPASASFERIYKILRLLDVRIELSNPNHTTRTAPELHSASRTVAQPVQAYAATRHAAPAPNQPLDDTEDEW